MKKLFILVFVLASLSMAQIKVFSAAKLDKDSAASDTVCSQSIKIKNSSTYKFSLQAVLTDSGAADIFYAVSNDGVTFAMPDSAGLVADSILKTSGKDGKGKGFFSFTAPPANFIKYCARACESDTATLTGWHNSLQLNIGD